MSLSRQLVDPNGLHFTSESFDRFGDDLSELLLSYIKYEDKIKLQCVSKQWNSLIFNKQSVLRVDAQYKNKDDVFRIVFSSRLSRSPTICSTRLGKILKKSANMAQIYLVTRITNPETYTVFLINDSVLSTIAMSCPRLESIKFNVWDVSPEAITGFGHQLGHRLKNLELMTGDCSRDLNKCRLMLELCPNVRSLVCDHYLLVDERQTLDLSRLNTIELTVTNNEAFLFVKFIIKYERQLRSLNLKIKFVERKIEINSILSIILHHISRLINLEDLTVSFHHKHNLSVELNETIVSKFSLIGTKCQKLNRLSFICRSSVSQSLDVWKMFENFIELRALRLDICHWSIREPGPRVTPLQKLRTLRIKCQSIDDHIFANIALFSPNLVNIELRLVAVMGQPLEETRAEESSAIAMECGDSNGETLDTPALQRSSNSPLLKSLVQIKIVCSVIDDFDPFITNMTKLSPNIKYLAVIARTLISNTSFQCLSQLKCLTEISLKLGDGINSVTDSGLYYLLNSCRRLKKIQFKFWLNITIKTIHQIIELANNRPISFECFGSQEDIYGIDRIEIPPNVFIDIFDSSELYSYNYVFKQELKF